jgi:hypothetical protein
MFSPRVITLILVSDLLLERERCSRRDNKKSPLVQATLKAKCAFRCVAFVFADRTGCP